jgi:hypothetical protein
MSPAPLTDDEIVKDAEVVEIPDTTAFKKLTSRNVHLVKWRDGPTALVESIPSDRLKRERLLVKLYRTWCAGQRGAGSIAR